MAYTDSNAIGAVTEVTGEAIVIRTDGTEEVITLGTEIYLGDVIETKGEGAVNIGFTDESSFAISDNAHVTIDEYVYDPVSESGDQDFSVTSGVFMYTSGLIGRENPDSVEIDTPVGSIGIRGTIIGGKIVPEGQGESQITVIEGAIVVRNDAGEQLLTNQFDTVKLSSGLVAPSAVEQLDVATIANNYSAVKNVSANLFSSFEDQIQAEESAEGVSEGLDESSVESNDDSESLEVADEAPLEQPVNAEPVMEQIQTETKDQNIEAQKDSLRDRLKEKILNADDTVNEGLEGGSQTQADSNNNGSMDGIGDSVLPFIPEATPSIAVGVSRLDAFSPQDGVEGFINLTKAGIKIAQLKIAGVLLTTIDPADFHISGPYAQHLRIEQEGNEFFLALNTDKKLIDTGAGVADFYDISSGSYVGASVSLSSPFNLAEITISKGGETSLPTSIDVLVDDAMDMLGIYTGVGNGIIQGANGGPGTGEMIAFNSDIDFKLIDGLGGDQDSILLDSGGSVNFDFSAPHTVSNMSGYSNDIRSVEHIYFKNGNDTDTLTLDLENVLRLIKTSDNIVGGKREFVIHKNGSDIIGGGLDPVNNAGDRSNGISFVDKDGNAIHLDGSNGFTHVGPQNFGSGANETTYEVYEHAMGVIKIESQIDGALTGGL